MEIDILYRHDSQSKVFENAKEVLQGHDVCGVMVNGRDEIIEYVKTCIEKNIIILTLSANDTILFCRAMTEYFNRYDTKRRPLIISMPVGIILDRAFYSTLMQRTVADIVLVNNKKQLKKILSLKTQHDDFADTFVSALPVIFNRYKIITPNNLCDKDLKCILFIVQNDIPKQKKDRSYVVDRIIEYSTKFKTRTVIVKPRNRLTDDMAHQQQFPYEKIFYETCKGKIPPNIIFSYNPINQLIELCDLAISFSSTAIIEVLLAGKYAAIIGDNGIAEGNGVSYFAESNLITSFNNILQDNIPICDLYWLESELDAPSLETVINSLEPRVILANNGLLAANAARYNIVDSYYKTIMPNVLLKNEALEEVFRRPKRRKKSIIFRVLRCFKWVRQN